MCFPPFLGPLNELFTAIPLAFTQALKVLLVDLRGVLPVDEVVCGNRHVVLLENLVHLPSVPEQFLTDSMVLCSLPMIPGR